MKKTKFSSVEEKFNFFEKRLEELHNENLIFKQKMLTSEKELKALEHALESMNVQNLIYKDKQNDIDIIKQKISVIKGDIASHNSNILNIEVTISKINEDILTALREKVRDNKFLHINSLLEDKVKNFDYEAFNKVASQLNEIRELAIHIYSEFSSSYKTPGDTTYADHKVTKKLNRIAERTLNSYPTAHSFWIKDLNICKLEPQNEFLNEIKDHLEIVPKLITYHEVDNDL